MRQQADATAVKLEQVDAAIRSIEDKAQERHQSQVAELSRTFTEFGESFKTHLSTEQLKQAKQCRMTSWRPSPTVGLTA